MDEGSEFWTRTLEADEVIQWPSEIRIWMTFSLSMVEGIGEVGCEEIQRAKGMGEGELVVC